MLEQVNLILIAGIRSQDGFLRQEGWNALFMAKNESEKRWKALGDHILLKGTDTELSLLVTICKTVPFPLPS